MTDFVLGATMLGNLVIALFFWRFWRETADRLFAFFALAFVIFAVNRFVLGLLDEDDEAQTAVYVLRLVGFGLIVAAIADKNRARGSAEPVP